jgi:cytochrome d ubiquinol oxidase subunit II
VSKADAITILLWVAVTLYALLGGADFGAGFWDLVAGGPERGARPRAFIDRVLTPVWEANHVWLIFMLVVTWSAFPDAFSAIFSTLFVPLCLVALGIVLRGAGFAFRHVVRGVRGQRALGATFALSSVITPFFMGTVVGAIATGRVPAEGAGDRLDSWLNLPSLAIGLLLVASCAYLAAVYLTSEARRAGDAELEGYFRLRAIASGLGAGAVAALGLVALRADARPLFDDLVGDALPLVVLSAVCGVAALVQLLRSAPGSRPLAVGAVAAVIWGWGVAQRPDILPGALTIDQAAAPDSTMTALFVVFGAALVVVLPALALLLTLHQRAMLEKGES